jgi:hypothetical protein
MKKWNTWTMMKKVTPEQNKLLYRLEGIGIACETQEEQQINRKC